MNKFGQLTTGGVALCLNRLNFVRGQNTGKMASSTNGPVSADDKFNLITRNLQVRLALLVLIYLLHIFLTCALQLLS